MDHQHAFLQLGANLLQIFADHVAILRVVHHDEQHGLLAQLFVLGVALLPFLDAELQVVGKFLGDDRALVLGELGAAGGIGQHGVLDDVLGDRLDQRVVADGLHEDRAVVVARRGGHVDLEGQAQVLLQQLVVDVLNALEPGQPGVVYVMGLVVKDGEFVDLAHDLAQVGLAVGGLSHRLGTEWSQKVVAQVVVFEGRFCDLARVDAVDVGQEQVAGRAHDAHVVLDVQGDLEVVPPVAPGVPIVRQHGIAEENAQPFEIGAQPIEHDDVGGDQQEIACQGRIRLIELVEIAPGHQQRQHLGLAGAGCHLDDEARPVLVEHVGGHRAGCIEAHQVEFVPRTSRIVKPYDGFNRLALREVVAELALRAIRLLDQVVRLEPPLQQRP